MKLAALYSGGKDSTFAIFRATKEMEHDVISLITMHPTSDESLLFHYPNSWVTQYLADAMNIPQMSFSVMGRDKQDEMLALEKAILQTKLVYGIQGVLYGGISSNYQKRAFEEICTKLDLEPIAPLWNIEPLAYLNELIDHGFQVMIVGISAMGLGRDWLGVTLDRALLSQLVSLSKKYGFNITFEGGEAETLVTDCPLFYKRLDIKKAKIHWDGQRGIFEILEVALIGRTR